MSFRFKLIAVFKSSILLTFFLIPNSLYSMNCHTSNHKVKELIELLSKEGKDVIANVEMQLPTNNAFLYHLNDGRVILLPNSLQSELEGVLFENRHCFDSYFTRDFFPIENNERKVHEYEQAKIKRVNEEIEYFKNYLNEKFKLKDSLLSRESLQVHYTKIMKLKRKKKAIPKDFVAIGALLGELIRVEKNAKWLLIKEYGTFNPFYTPHILTNDGKIISFFSSMAGSMNNKIKDINFIFNKLAITDPKLKIEILDIVKKDYLIL